MRNAYALLGLSFLLVFGGAYVLFEKGKEPAKEELENNEIVMSLTLTSSVFEHNKMIPPKYTCDGENTNPPLTITGIPEGTESLVLVMDDPDIPTEVKESMGIEKFNHWTVYNLPADTSAIAEGDEIGTTGLNSREGSVYTGPCPPTQYEPTTHRYIFRLYALTGSLNFIKAPTLDEVEAAAQGSAIEKAELIGLYTRVESAAD